MNGPNTAPLPLRALCVKNGVAREINEAAAREVPLTVRWGGGEARLWAWPHDRERLAAGHVLLDCLHDAAPDEPSPRGLPPVLVHGEEDGALRVELLPAPPPPPPAPPPPPLHAAELIHRMAAFIKLPGLWDDTGCYHRAALLDPDTGLLVHLAEDIGRHNCLDRLAGHIALSGGSALLDPARLALLVTARITASLYCKARRIGLRTLISRSAVTSASFEAAGRQGVTLAGFCRPEENRLTVFADPAGRIVP